MRNDIQPNERAYSTKEVAEELNIATPTVRKYGQVLERSGYEFFKNGTRRVFVQSDIEALQTIRDTEKSLEVIAIELVKQQKNRLTSDSTDIATADTYDMPIEDPHKMRELLVYISQELAASREMNAKLATDMEEMKETVGRLRQDHHAISSGIGNSTQKMNKLIDQQQKQYEEMLEEEKEKNDQLQKEIEDMRREQQEVWHAQEEFNSRLESKMTEQRSGFQKFMAFFTRK
ncbi:MerR family transcriptional regulator [Salimicrobium halophilum]|uniref:HTH merR-type domain-containing protein n=1 Tax=Salimicrobium halophilum TaxID=86666 RepID=A0A1G8UWB6_9BACI|nr:hypothetical protein [Salimicrobium halophilum]SDJ57210.1 hypothetical protein SAMN04490247_2394 [Salimicrobium halophilum]